MIKIAKAKLAVLVAAVFLIGGAAGLLLEGTALGAAIFGGGERPGAAGIDVARLEKLENYLSENYYKPITEGAIRTGLLRGLFMSANDPYTMYYTPEELKDAMEKTHGELSGVGLTLMPNEDGVIEVVEVVKGSPADEAGVLKGDLLLTVDGKGYSGEELAKAVEAARGEAGTKVTLGVSRGGDTREFTITRSVFATPTVEKSMVKNDRGESVGVIKISSFTDNTAEDFKSALSYMKNKKAKAIVIDVRNNPGGLMESALSIDGMLLGKGVVCYAEDGAGKRTEYSADGEKLNDLPYAVLIDMSSVSAAEIFALGIQANGGGKLVGQTTYGKGLIQRLERFDEGDGARITIMQYVTPSGKPVNGVGISPDIEIENTGDEDRQLAEAIRVASGG
ncbi:MAG: S41 family peptidase [Clostridiales Family XIII bacterium]|jgi:carboxyl-terminal processing protease|nr:S41 family peptidase [Clostridiales Family XIII bacterium]